MNEAKRLSERLRDTDDANPLRREDIARVLDALLAERERMREALRVYLAEFDSPVPDYGLRRRYRDDLRELLSPAPAADEAKR